MCTGPNEKKGRYASASFALLTKHAKERAIGPCFNEALGAGVLAIDTFDTDTLGTFTREVPRAGSQIEAARRKAELSIELSGLPLGLGSEGSFGPGPFGFLATNLEVIVMRDRDMGIEVVGVAVAPGHQASGIFDRWELVEDFASSMKFPSHGLILRPEGQDDPRIFKDCGDFATLRAVFRECSAMSREGLVFVESDLRAHRNPTRMETIGEACADLARHLRWDCPGCGMPGFGLAKKICGLPCLWCGAPTNAIRAEEFKCPACAFVEIRESKAPAFGDPGQCPACNP
jgi:hypothetical protein